MVTCQDTDYKRGLIASERRPILPKAGTHLPDQGQAGRLAHLQGLKNLRHHMGGVTKLMLWHPCSCSRIIMAAS